MAWELFFVPYYGISCIGVGLYGIHLVVRKDISLLVSPIEDVVHNLFFPRGSLLVVGQGGTGDQFDSGSSSRKDPFPSAFPRKQKIPWSKDFFLQILDRQVWLEV